MTLYVDNLSVIKLLKTLLLKVNWNLFINLFIKNSEFHQRNKHIDVSHYHFIRNKFNEKDFLLQHIASGESAGRPSENRENIWNTKKATEYHEYQRHNGHIELCIQT